MCIPDIPDKLAVKVNYKVQSQEKLAIIHIKYGENEECQQLTLKIGKDFLSMEMTNHKP